MLTEHNHYAVNSDFYAGFRQATIDFELKYRRQSVPVDDTQLAMIFVQLAADNKSDLWKAGYQAGFFAAFYGVLHRWTVSSSWTLGEMASVVYRIDCVGRAAL
jgi:hypothetical protein